MMAAATALMSFAFTKLRLFSANSGSEACPSCEMLLASSTENGNTPAANKVMNTKCGPDSGMMPMSTAKRIIQGMLSLTHDSMWR